MREPVLSRALLLRGGLDEMLARSAPEVRIWTQSERIASRAAVLAANPDKAAGIWLFAYGSLLWNPTVLVTERRRARVHGWHRSFCLVARAGRGTAAQPGLLLGLVPGGLCDGLALRVAEQDCEAELDLLWRREMIAGSYVPRWLTLEPEGQAGPQHAIAFTIDPDGPFYAGDLQEEEVIRRLATARGELGSCAEYLLHTRDALRAEGLTDPTVERLAAGVTALAEQAAGQQGAG
jgi:cation transport protein ChaC